MICYFGFILKICCFYFRFFYLNEEFMLKIKIIFFFFGVCEVFKIFLSGVLICFFVSVFGVFYN